MFIAERVHVAKLFCQKIIRNNLIKKLNTLYSKWIVLKWKTNALTSQIKLYSECAH